MNVQARITTSITYKLPIKDFDCTKTFLSEVEEISRQLKKSDFWVPTVVDMINNGLKIVFIHLWNTDEQWFDGKHYKKEMVFETFIGFDEIGMSLHSMGEFAIKSIEVLLEKYKNNPDFIFTQLDWDAPKETIIEEFLEELKEYDYIEVN